MTTPFWLLKPIFEGFLEYEMLKRKSQRGDLYERVLILERLRYINIIIAETKVIL